MSFEIKGKIISIGDTQRVSDRFAKREFVIEKNEDVKGNNFTDYIKFQLTQDRCDLIDNHNVGDEINIKFNIRGNKWEKNGQVSYFTNLDAWQIESFGGSAAVTNDAPPISENDLPPQIEEDDLPF